MMQMSAEGHLPLTMPTVSGRASHRRSSLRQLALSVAGQTTRTRLMVGSALITPAACTVLPRPISSAIRQPGRAEA